MDRRGLLIRGAGLTGALILGGCSKPADGEAASAVDGHGLEMPLESEPHERTLMQWPVSRAVYDAANLLRVQKAIARIANTISQYEPVAMLVGKRHAAAAKRLLGPSVELWDIPTDDLWCRDSGPTFVRQRDGSLAVSLIRFNGWGRKQPHGNDAKIAQSVAKRLGLPVIESGLIGEQGGVEHDGAGTLLAHASCWDNPNRNRLPRHEIERRLLRALGGSRMIWAPGIQGADITDYHIDALARFVAPGKVLIQLGEAIDPGDPWSVSGHETLTILQSARDARGNKLEIVRLPDPVEIRSTQDDFVASYVNYYVCNGAVIAAQFGDRMADGRAREVLQQLYPGRVVEMIDIDAIGESGGGIHCATQQQPLERRP